MPKSSKLFLFPDVNVWLALTVDAHIQHLLAHRWLSSVDLDVCVCFCRVTQISFLRLLTTEAVMGRDKTLSQAEAWKTYDRWLENDRVCFLAEPQQVEEHFRSLSNHSRIAPKEWADAYIAAFAYAADLTLVTFDQSFRSKLKNVQLLSI